MNTSRLSTIRTILFSTLAAGALALFAGCATAPQSSAIPNADAGRLVIKRSFTMGGLPLKLMIDGRQVTTLGFNRAYETPISAGPHVISAVAIPEGQSISRETHLDIQKGQTYTLTLARVGSEIVLR